MSSFRIAPLHAIAPEERRLRCRIGLQSPRRLGAH